MSLDRQNAKHKRETAQWDEKRATILEKAEDSGIDLDEFSKLPVSRFMADAIVDSDVSVQLVAYMTENPAEVKRIYSLSEARQAVEIGKIEARLSDDQPKKTAKRQHLHPSSRCLAMVYPAEVIAKICH